MFIEYYRKNSTWLIIAAVLLVVNVAVFFFMTLPNIDAESVGRNRLQQINSKVADIESALNQRQELHDHIVSNKAALETFYSEVLGKRSEKLTSILKERHDISGQFGIVPEYVRYMGEPVQRVPLEKFSMSFPLEGTYESLRFFINTLENSRNFFIIEDIELDSSSGNRQELSMRITVSTFFHGKKVYERDEEARVAARDEEFEL
jgi:Tfp pilus assembly protein PilO